MTFKQLAVGQRFIYPQTGWIYEKVTDDLFDNEETGTAVFIKTISDLDGSRCSFPQLEEVILISQTPRTDAEELTDVSGFSYPLVKASFAKQLEQELQQAQHRITELEDQLSDIRTIAGR